jgi:hypothetical protein
MHLTFVQRWQPLLRPGSAETGRLYGTGDIFSLTDISHYLSNLFNAGPLLYFVALPVLSHQAVNADSHVDGLPTSRPSGKLPDCRPQGARSTTSSIPQAAFGTALPATLCEGKYSNTSRVDYFRFAFGSRHYFAILRASTDLSND